MKKVITILFFIGLLFFNFKTIQAQTPECAYFCNYETHQTGPQAFCQFLGKGLGNLFDCDGNIQGVCGMYGMPVCCCTPNEENDLESFSTRRENSLSFLTSGEASRFNPPDLQIDLGINFSKPTCTITDSGEVCEINWLGEYLTAIYNLAIKFGGLIAAVILMAGGVLWLISGGDVSKINQAKEMLTGSVIGLTILLSSYVLLVQVNPEIIKFNPLKLGVAKKMDDLIVAKNNNQAEYYKNSGCASDSELTNGVNFYATGYCKPEWENTEKFFCFIAMNCSCPKNERDRSKNCDKWFGKTNPGYAPCKPFAKDTAYCNAAANGAQPYIGSIAGPNCSNLPLGSQVCFDNKTYTITDRGSAIQGKRIDIWTGTDCGKANQVTGVGTLKKGACE